MKPTVLPPPPILSSGNYHPVHLMAFLGQARQLNLKKEDIAKTLRVKTDRVHHFYGAGWNSLRDKARQMELLS